MTPAQFRQVLRGYEKRQERAWRERIKLAWTIEALSRQKTLPPLERLLKPRTPTRTPIQAKDDFEELKRRLGA